MVVHTNTAARYRALRRKVELGLPEVHLGVVPTAGNIDVSFSRWEQVLVVNIEAFCAECRRFRHEYIGADQNLARLLAFGRGVAVSERLAHYIFCTRLER